jgi:hypothetical protein
MAAIAAKNIRLNDTLLHGSIKMFMMDFPFRTFMSPAGNGHSQSIR